MGMFDWVNHKTKCPGCGAVVDGFQTKDTGCTLDMVEITDPRVTCFYSSCKECGKWLEYLRVPSPVYELYTGRGMASEKIEGADIHLDSLKQGETA